MTTESRRSARAPYVAALITALLGAALLGVYVRRLRTEISGGAPIALIALNEDLPAGSLIREGHLLRHEVPETFVDSRQVRAADASKVLGVRTSVALEANQTLCWTDLASTARDDRVLSDHVPPGMRAIVVPSSGTSTISSFLRPGDRVDVLVTRSSDEGRSVTIPLLQNILVLSVGNQLSGADVASTTGARTVSLLVTVDQASLLIHAKTDGVVSLVLRNPDDLEVSDGLPDTYDNDVLEPESRNRRQRRAVLERVR